MDAAEVRAAAASPDSLHTFLTKQPMGAAQLRILQSAADPEQSNQTSIVALQAGVETGRPTRTHVEPGAVTIIDTPEGRVVVEHTASAGGQWMVVAPGTADNIATAVNRMVARLPAADDWHSYRRSF
ncbi:ESX secretion-associated protein EspG [Mycolicibacter sinensis]|nr:ESX secretion-associated protein EspG [Mycolicibacter sinensis]